MMTSEAPQDATTASGRNRWFQLGLLSAGAAAPLIARWRSLRAAEQAEAIRARANARWSDAVSRVSAALPSDNLQASLRQALPQAQEGLRQVSAAARDALQRLPAVPAPEPPSAPESHRRTSATLWLVGLGVGVVAAGTVAYIVLRNRISAANDDDTLVEIPLTSPVAPVSTFAATDATGAMTPTLASEGPAITEESPADEPGVAEPMVYHESDAEGAAFVGNILTRVYHPIDSKRLPTPAHRIYFASEADATTAGYRPDGAEMASRANDTTTQRD